MPIFPAVEDEIFLLVLMNPLDIVDDISAIFVLFGKAIRRAWPSFILAWSREINLLINYLRTLGVMRFRSEERQMKSKLTEFNGGHSPMYWVFELNHFQKSAPKTVALSLYL